jgi:hypothetical protein
MATRDHFASNNPFPRFLSDHAQEPEQPSIGKAWDTFISSRTVHTTVLVFTAAAIVFAIVTVGNPIVLFASVTVPQGSTSAPEDGRGLSMPAFQSTANAEALLPPAPRGDELLTAFKTAFEGNAEVAPPRAEALFNQFQDWAAEQDARLSRGPLQPPLDARAQVVKKARALPLPKPRPVQPEQTAAAQEPVENAQWPARRFGWRN